MGWVAREEPVRGGLRDGWAAQGFRGPHPRVAAPAWTPARVPMSPGRGSIALGRAHPCFQTHRKVK